MHRGDPSRFAPFVGINCAALPEQLIESELFGHEKGAFTDAKTEKKGVFEQAYGGSILLDEIGEMRTDLQSKLLRVLEEMKIRRIGGKEDIPIEATVFATTNRDLEAAVEEGGVPRRPVLPAERLLRPHPAAAGAQGGHPRAGAPLPGGVLEEIQEAGDTGLLPRGGAGA